jgi:hypothetical protein
VSPEQLDHSICEIEIRQAADPGVPTEELPKMSNTIIKFPDPAARRCGTPGKTPQVGWSSLVITDASQANDPLDSPRLRLALARRPWARQRGRALVERLAQELLWPISCARCALPHLKPKVLLGVPLANRRRQPGGGRKRNEAKAILAAGVRRAMQHCGLPAGIWRRRDGGEVSPFLQLLGICWRIASGEPSGPKVDLSRLTARRRRWEFIPAQALILSVPPTPASVAAYRPAPRIGHA